MAFLILFPLSGFSYSRAFVRRINKYTQVLNKYLINSSVNEYINSILILHCSLSNVINEWEIQETGIFDQSIDYHKLLFHLFIRILLFVCNILALNAPRYHHKFGLI